MMRVLSEIYPPEINPVRDGWYLVLAGADYGLFSMFEWRDGWWRYADGTLRSRENWRPWCGLAFNPAAAEQQNIFWMAGDGRITTVDGVFVPGATCDD